MIMLPISSVLRNVESDIVISHFGQIEWEEDFFDLIAAIKLAGEKDPSFRKKVKVDAETIVLRWPM